MKVMTVSLPGRRHYARPESQRTLCGLVGGLPSRGVSDCGRCTQILLGVDTSRPAR